MSSIGRLGRRRHGFTLIEMMLVVAIIAVLIGMLLPAIQKARDAASRTQCANNLRNIGAALVNANTSLGKMPQWGGTYASGGSVNFNVQNFTGNVHFWLLPYLEQGNLMPLNWGGGLTSSTGNLKVPTPKVYVCAGDPTMPDDTLAAAAVVGNRVAVASYAANSLVFSPTYPKLSTTFTDGTSNTAVFLEQYGICSPAAGTHYPTSTWSLAPAAGIYDISLYVPVPTPTPAVPPAPYNGPFSTPIFQSVPSPDGRVASNLCNPSLVQTPHPGIMNVLMADGAVHQAVSNVSQTTWWAILTPNGAGGAPDQPGSDW